MTRKRTELMETFLPIQSSKCDDDWIAGLMVRRRVNANRMSARSVPCKYGQIEESMGMIFAKHLFFTAFLWLRFCVLFFSTPVMGLYFHVFDSEILWLFSGHHQIAESQSVTRRESVDVDVPIHANG
jgi:hypothetical protein